MSAKLLVVVASVLVIALLTSTAVRAQPDQAPRAAVGELLPSPEASGFAPAPETAAPASAPETSVPTPTAEAPAPKPEAPTPPMFKAEQLDQLLAPIALYPDALLAQILMAATYPLEVVKADRWLQDPSHATLQGDQLASAIEVETWDPSVKSLVPFPYILRMMDEQLDWTEQLGNAVVVQQPDVMDAIQRLRHQAAAAGTLWSNSQQRVTTERQGIVIQPANPELVYPPVYSPAGVYGPWPYPDYRPSIYPRSRPTSRDPSASGSVWGLLSSDRYGVGALLIGPSVGFTWMSTSLTPSIVTCRASPPAPGTVIRRGSACPRANSPRAHRSRCSVDPRFRLR